MNTDKINGYGAILRFITPALIAIIGTMILTSLSEIKEKVSVLDNHFTNHLSHHVSLAKDYEGRLTRLEAKVIK